MKRILAAAIAAFSLGVAIAPADATQIYSTTDGLAGNQAWTGSLGLDFTVNGPIVVSALGVFDSGSDGLASSIAVTIYNRMTQTALLAPIVFAAGTANAAGSAYLFQAITPLRLAAGSYQLTAFGYSGSENNYNYGVVQGGNGGPITFNSLGGKLTADGTEYSAGIGYANNADVGTTRYGAGSMLAAAVPEPGMWAMMFVGFGGIGFTMRSRRKFAVSFS